MTAPLLLNFQKKVIQLYADQTFPTASTTEHNLLREYQFVLGSATGNLAYNNNLCIPAPHQLHANRMQSF